MGKDYKPHGISKTGIAMLWNRLSALYGGAWERESGAVGGQTYLAWEQALETLSEAHVVRGYNAVMQESSEFPPNLIKFLRLCRTAEPYSDHRNQSSLPRAKPRYSVRRIERMKQQFLFGELLTIPKLLDKHMVVDWCREDEDMLLDAMAQFTPDSSLEEVNAVIDYIEFSHGRQIDNAYLEAPPT